MAIPLLGSNLWQVVRTHLPLSPVTKQCNLVPVVRQLCPAARNVIVGLALHWSYVTGKWFIHLLAEGLSLGDERESRVLHSWGMVLSTFQSVIGRLLYPNHYYATKANY